jgi:hypothetical protein
MIKTNFCGSWECCGHPRFKSESSSAQCAQIQKAVQKWKNKMGTLSGEITTLRGMPEVVAQRSNKVTKLLGDASVSKC